MKRGKPNFKVKELIGMRIELAIDNSCSVFTFARNPKIRRPFEDGAALPFVQI